MNEQATHWIGECDWTYTTSLEVTRSQLDEDRVDLVFDGLDTVAEVAVNGQVVGSVENMHVRCRFAVKAQLQEGANEVTVRFASPVRYMLEMQERVGARPGVGSGANPRQLPHWMIRKMACNFGWDWGPQLVTCGIWRPCRIEAWSVARLGDARPVITQAEEQRATLEVHVDGEVAAASDGLRVRLTVADPDGASVAERSAGWSPGSEPIPLHVDQPRLWWPRGYGEQPLYRLFVELLDADGNPLDRREQRIGLRTATLEIEPDSENSFTDSTDLRGG